MRPASSIVLFVSTLILLPAASARAQYATRSGAERIQSLARSIDRQAEALLWEAKNLYSRPTFSEARALHGVRRFAREAADFHARIDRRTFVEVRHDEAYRSLLSTYDYARPAFNSPSWSREGRRAINRLRDDMAELRGCFRPPVEEVWPYERLYEVANDVESRAERLLDRVRFEYRNNALSFDRNGTREAMDRFERLAEESEELRKSVQRHREDPFESSRQLDKVIDRWRRARDGVDLFSPNVEREYRGVWGPIAELQRFFSGRPRHYGRD